MSPADRTRRTVTLTGHGHEWRDAFWRRILQRPSVTMGISLWGTWSKQVTHWNLFFVLLTVHLGIILDNDQLDTHFLYLQYVYYNSLHVSSIICSSSGGWIVLMQQSVAVQCTGWERMLCSSLSTCAPDGHWLRVMIPDAASIQFNLLMMSI